MGVIRNFASLQYPSEDRIEDVLDQIEDQTPNLEVEVRRERRSRHKTKDLKAIDVVNPKKGGKKRKQRQDNANFLLSLADPDETFDVTIHDFISPSISVFCQLHIDQDNIEIWNDFFNCVDPEAWLQSVIVPQGHSSVQGSITSTIDERKNHPAFAASECFRRIDGDLRLVLKKRHVPMGALSYLEHELVTFFINRPQSIYHSQIPNSFERLLLHALCQYMDLGALSYDRNGSRWTRVRNNNSTFQLPLTLLSTYLEQRMQRARPRH